MSNIQTILLNIFWLISGFFLLIKGADWFVDGAAGFARRLGIPQLVIGLTIVAMGTSAPEAAVSITAALRHNAGISIGNVVGSNILNILIILGITCIIATLKIQISTLHYEIPYMVAITILLLLFGYTSSIVNRIEGAILWFFFLLYLVYLYILSRNGKEEPVLEEKHVPQLLLYTIAGIVFIILGSNVTVNGATAFAKMFGLSDRFIGLTIVAFGTSLPELVTSVTAAKKGNSAIAVGNIVGSNIFNILFVIGTTALICPVPFESNFIVDSVIAILAGILLFLCTVRSRQLKRPCGILMLLCYFGYLIYLLH